MVFAARFVLSLHMFAHQRRADAVNVFRLDVLNLRQGFLQTSGTHRHKKKIVNRHKKKIVKVRHGTVQHATSLVILTARPGDWHHGHVHAG